MTSGGDGIAHLGQKIADDAHRQHQVEIEDIQPQGIGADDAKHADDRHEHLGGMRSTLTTCLASSMPVHHMAMEASSRMAATSR
jgi:hypothetical protein